MFDTTVVPRRWPSLFAFTYRYLEEPEKNAVQDLGSLGLRGGGGCSVERSEQSYKSGRVLVHASCCRFHPAVAGMSDLS